MPRRSSLLAVAASVLAAALFCPALFAQAADIPSAAPAGGTLNPEQHGLDLLQQMATALGGDAWRDRQTETVLGHSAAFFRGQPTGVNLEFAEYFQIPSPPTSSSATGRPPAERIEFISPKGIILPGKKHDVIQIWTADNGYEITYKGKTAIPKDIATDYLRRRAHSIDSIFSQWLKQPGVVVVYEGTTTVERHPADKVTILSANNDAVTLELDSSSHLPLARTFQWRNEQFQDHDEDREEYSDYHAYNGVQTPLTVFRYRNGDLVNQRFLSKVQYNQQLPPGTFDPDAPLPQKK